MRRRPPRRPLSKENLERLTYEALQGTNDALRRLTGKQQVQVLDSILQTLVNRINWLREIYKIDGPIHPKAEARPTCSICRLKYVGHGNNAEPINDGRCCNMCNATHVIPARIAMIRRHQQ